MKRLTFYLASGAGVADEVADAAADQLAADLTAAWEGHHDGALLVQGPPKVLIRYSSIDAVEIDDLDVDLDDIEGEEGR